MLIDGVRQVLTAIEDKVQTFLAALSVIAVGLMVANEFVAPEYSLPIVTWHWGDLQSFLRFAIWLLFICYMAVYCLFSQNRMRFFRHHWLEIAVCLCWIPNYQYAVFHHFSSFLSVNTLQLVGMLAHVWRVARWTITRFSTHPVIVTGASAIVLVGTASAILSQIEPATFPTIWDAGWYVISTVTTIGYGDLVPKTALGRLVGVAVMLGGISLAGVFLGLVSEMVRSRLPIKKDPTTELQEQLLSELRENNRLLRAVLIDRSKQAAAEKDEGRPHENKPSGPKDGPA